MRNRLKSALGRADLDAVYVEHPIQDQTPQEIAAKAESVIDEIVARLTWKRAPW
jgi:hypothetical protein